MKKKVLALVVLAAMLISILPMAAFAATGDLVLPDTTATNVVVAPNSYSADFENGKIEGSAGVETKSFTISNVSSGLTVTPKAKSDATVADNTDGSWTVTAVGGDSDFKFVVAATASGTYSFKANTTTYTVVFTADSPANADSTVTRMYVSEEKADADNKDEVEIDVMLMGYDSDDSAKPIIDQAVDLYVYSTRGSADKFTLDGTTTGSVGATKNGVTKLTGVTTNDGWFTLKVKSSVTGSGKIYISLTDTEQDIRDYIKGDMGALEAKMIPDGSGVYFSNYSFSATDNYQVAFATHTSDALANGSKYYDVKVTVTSNGMPVSGEKVSFSVNKTGATLTAYEATTDSKGQAKVKITATKPNDYVVTVKVANKSTEYKETYSFNPATINSVKKVGDDNQKIALDKSDVTLKFAFYDANGNKVKLTPINIGTYDDKEGFKTDSAIEGVTLMAVTSPSGAEINDDMKVNEDFTFKTNTDNNLEIEVQQDAIDKAGDYEIKLSLINGSSVTYKFNVKEQGDITGMTLKYDTTSLAADTKASTGDATVKLVDAEGYAKKITLPNNNIKFSIDNASVATIDDKGAVTVDTEDPAVITVTAIDTDSKQVATATINIVKKPSALKVTPKSSYSVGEEATLEVQIVDVDGKAVSYGANSLTKADAEVIILTKPDGAVVSGDDVSVLTDAQESGKFNVDLTSNKEGKVKAQVILTVEYTDNGNTITKTLTGSADVNFGAASGINGNNIVFIIGAPSYVVDGKPVASTSVPFIENGRTFLGIRDMGMAMGIIGDENIVWNSATQTAKLVKDGITVEVTVGAAAIKVTKDNVTTEVAIDAPAQNKDGRVFLPFRAVFEAFGYSVEYANGSITVTK